jgi:hypothetical protein
MVDVNTPLLQNDVTVQPFIFLANDLCQEFQQYLQRPEARDYGGDYFKPMSMAQQINFFKKYLSDFPSLKRLDLKLIG